MGRYSENKAYNHRVTRDGFDLYTLSWRFDRYFSGSRLRHPTSRQRDTGAAGAMRFCNKHGLAYPAGLEDDLKRLWERDKGKLRK